MPSRDEGGRGIIGRYRGAIVRERYVEAQCSGVNELQHRVCDDRLTERGRLEYRFEVDRFAALNIPHAQCEDLIDLIVLDQRQRQAGYACKLHQVERIAMKGWFA